LNDLIVWQKSHKLALKIYELTRSFPKEEKFWLVSQMRRCAVSVLSNMAEGFKRKGYKSGLSFFNINDASLAELKYQTLLSLDLEYLTSNQYDEVQELEGEVGRLLNGWQRNYYSKTTVVS